MAEVVGVVFRGGVKVYHFDPAGLELSRGDRVVVQTSSGPEIGQVVEPPHTVDESELPAPLKKVVRVATGKDLETEAAGQNLRREAMETCRRLIAEHGLDMKLVDADIAFGGDKITFSFFAEERVDFRALVSDLAKALKRRIELRQVGAREEARMIGGLGPCGRALCCSCFPGDDTPVSIRMAKEQNLPLNPMKISGLCGRLMCCLKYEQEQYVCFRKEAPPKGTKVQTLLGEGVVAGYNLTKEAITVRLENGAMTEVRLCVCQHQEDGGLIVVPEEPKEEPAPVSWLADTRAGFDPLVIAEEEEAVEALPVVEAEVVLNENGEPIDVVVAETTRKSRRRRGGSRRRGRGRRPNGDGDEAAAASGSGAEDAGQALGGAGDRSGGEARTGKGPSDQQDGSQRPGSGERARGHAAKTQGEGGAEAGTGGGSGGRRRHRASQPAERRERSSQAGAGGDAAGEHRAQGGNGDQPGTSSTKRRRRRRKSRGGNGAGAAGEDGSGGGANESAGGGGSAE